MLAYTEHALVSTWLESDHSLAQVITDGTQEERDRVRPGVRQVPVRRARRGPGCCTPIPHPGNFRIMPDGRLGVVDYGAVARLPDGLPEPVGRLLRHAVDGEYDLVLEGLRDEGFLKRTTDLDADTIARYIGPFVEPASVERFTFSREWMRAQTLRVSALTSEGMGTAMKINLPPQYLLIHRVWLGGVGVLSQLGATAPFRVDPGGVPTGIFRRLSELSAGSETDEIPIQGDSLRRPRVSSWPSLARRSATPLLVCWAGMAAEKHGKHATPTPVVSTSAGPRQAVTEDAGRHRGSAKWTRWAVPVAAGAAGWSPTRVGGPRG